MARLIENLFARTTLAHPRITTLMLTLVLGFFLLYADNFKLDASADSLLLEFDDDLQYTRAIGERYGVQEFMFVTITPDGPLLSDDSLRLIDEIQSRITKLPQVDSVISVLDVPLLKNSETASLSEVADSYKTLRNDNVDRDRAISELTSSPIYSNFLVSEDATTTALQVFLQAEPIYQALLKRRDELALKRHLEGLSSAEQAELERVLTEYQIQKDKIAAETRQTVSDIRNILNDYTNRGTFYLGGLPMVTVDMIAFIRSDLIVFGLGVFLFLIMMLGLVFRKFRWVFLPLLSCIYAGTLMIGLLGFVGWQVTVISSNFISLMLIITMSINIHLTVRYRELNRFEPDASQGMLVRRTAKELVWPCLYSVLTTIIGFGSLVVSNIKPVMDFGWMMSIGLIVVFLTSFLLFPAILVQLPRRTAHRGHDKKSPVTAALARLTERYGNAIVVGYVGVLIASLIGISRLQVENSFVNYFSNNTEIYQGLKLIDQKLGGTTPMDIIVKFPPPPEPAEDEEDELSDLFGDIEADKSTTWFTPDKIDRIGAVHKYLEGLASIGKVVSLETMVQVAEDLNGGQRFDAFELGVLYKRLPDELKKAALDPYIFIDETDDRDEARISARILDSLPGLRRNQLLQQIDRDLQQKLGIPKDEYRIGGLLVLYNNMLQSLFRSQILTLGAVMVGICIMLLILFRSFTLAAIGMIPNVLAALAILGLMGLIGMPLDLMTITIAAITIGIAVDNCIHYIYRFREALPQFKNYLETLHYCHDNIGKAMFYTSITIIVGFSILVLSNFIPTIYFGVLTATAMGIALFGALALLPKLILIVKPFGPEEPEQRALSEPA